MNTTRIRHISHNDLDGYGATILTELIVKNYPEGMFTVDFMNITPNRILSTIRQTINEIDNYDLVIVTDLAISQEVVDVIVKSGQSEKFRVMDHHVSAVNDSKYSWLNLNRYDMDKSILTTEEYNSGKRSNGALIPLTCGTKLYYDFIRNDNVFDMQVLALQSTNSISHLVKTITSYDTFTFDREGHDKSIVNEDAPRLNTLFHILGHDEFKLYVDDYIHDRGIEWMQLTTSSIKYPWIAKVIELEDVRNKKYVEAALKRLTVEKINYSFSKNGEIHNINANIGIVFADRNGPMIGKAVRDAGVDCDFCAVIANLQVSLYRVKPGYDVAVIAESLGGGGHVAASGFTITFDDANRLNKIHFMNMLYCASNSSKQIL